jgi:hypothetical protein
MRLSRSETSALASAMWGLRLASNARTLSRLMRASPRRVSRVPAPATVAPQALIQPVDLGERPLAVARGLVQQRALIAHTACSRQSRVLVSVVTSRFSASSVACSSFRRRSADAARASAAVPATSKSLRARVFSTTRWCLASCKSFIRAPRGDRWYRLLPSAPRRARWPRARALIPLTRAGEPCTSRPQACP